MAREYHNKLLSELKAYIPMDQEELNAKKAIIDFVKSNEVIVGTENQEGHIVASAWIVNKERTKVLMAHHKVLDIWVQLGGHTEQSEAAYIAALREGYEESGLMRINEVDSRIFDLAVYYFPQSQKRKAHYHYDIRYIFEADEHDKIVVSCESNEVKWIGFDELNRYTDETALIRMMDKARK